MASYPHQMSGDCVSEREAVTSILETFRNETGVLPDWCMSELVQRSIRKQGLMRDVFAAGVRKNTLMVLTHLILNDMMKVCSPTPVPASTVSSDLIFSFQAVATCSVTRPHEISSPLALFILKICRACAAVPRNMQVVTVGAGGAVQVKGHIAKMAVCLQDEDPRISALAHLFFQELSHKVTKVRPTPHTL